MISICSAASSALPLGAAADGARHVQPRGDLGAAGQHEARQVGELGVEAVAVVLERGDLRVADPQPVGDAERDREIGAEIEELVLNASQHLAHLGGEVSGERETDVRVQLVDGAERGDPAVELRHPAFRRRGSSPRGLPTGVDPGEPHWLIALAGHGHRLRRMEIRPAR